MDWSNFDAIAKEVRENRGYAKQQEIKPDQKLYIFWPVDATDQDIRIRLSVLYSDAVVCGLWPEQLIPDEALNTSIVGEIRDEAGFGITVCKRFAVCGRLHFMSKQSVEDLKKWLS